VLVRVADAGGGAGTWSVELAPQSTTAGASLDLPGTLVVPPAGEAELPVVARVAADATPGAEYGFVVLRRGDVTRRIPYLFVAERPALAASPPIQLKRIQRGDTRVGADRVQAYGYPLAPFGNAPDQPLMQEDGAEKLYVTHLNVPAANIGVSVLLQSAGSRIDPFLLGARDENEVQGFAGTPVDVNQLTFDYLSPIGAAAASLPRQQAFYVAVDSGRELYTERRLAGRYVLRFWVNDVTPPSVRLLTTRVAAGRPAIVVRTLDAGAGVDPYSITVGYGRTLVGASAYDPFTGIAVFPLPSQAAKLKPGKRKATIQVSDFEEAKNVNSTGTDIMPNTRFAHVTLEVVDRPVVTWIAPAAKACVGTTVRLVVAASSPRAMRTVRFVEDGTRTVGVVRKATAGLSGVTWQTKGARRGTHTIAAVATDATGRVASASRSVRVCP
jgi:hypothetical protein